MSYVRNPSQDNTELGRYVDTELGKIEDTFRANDIENLAFKVWYSEPDKPRAGQVYYADGTTWNPASGEGIYRYSLGGAWVFLG